MTIMTSRRWAIVFFCSLALNLFLAGLVITDKFFDHRHGRAFGRMLYSAPWAMRVVGDEIRPQVRDIFRKHRDAIRANRQELHKTHMQLNAMLLAEPFQREQFSASLGKLRELTLGAQMRMHQDMAVLTAGLTTEQRQELAGAVEKWLERRARRAAHRHQRRERRERDRD
ncbi:MAG: periplasmic heavy metal sensor [Rhodospirillales bacterium]|jgi:uncharacterized membrane protein|nr:hypothetical protein [Rhodospirillaceae bacterium]MDP6430064.1 periplasmic heavy metal sensor [Rhodospirillales bacterium]MDP6642739.1 periplasmic heavy metal sensor [Rhodospirillales bacterium]MDP6843664.1 periplasmic heavy metal sensor [Rhodospirillales bacterium]|tara:strand:+ start:281 stop:790 length:510 start_codon:yes stop_codon:yes gene_type:complete